MYSLTGCAHERLHQLAGHGFGAEEPQGTSFFHHLVELLRPPLAFLLGQPGGEGGREIRLGCVSDGVMETEGRFSARLEDGG